MSPHVAEDVTPDCALGGIHSADLVPVTTNRVTPGIVQIPVAEPFAVTFTSLCTRHVHRDLYRFYLSHPRTQKPIINTNISICYRLPQLAVLAKILCLLMVVMCGAVPAMVRSVSLYSTCSLGNITVYRHQILAVGRNDQNAPYQKLTTQSEDFSGKLYIFAEESKRYICFNKRWK
ncbi:uncharacterized protein LOC108623144, partial [Ceratina calcarata]|uniref:Uncharacterized protein LOC108623144 n=1 Tax=Ceratina calcarata TaxID=156304 RepID=A0AAJ7IUT2_9HYME